MKRFSTILLALAAMTMSLGFYSCGDDEEKDQPSTETTPGNGNNQGDNNQGGDQGGNDQGDDNGDNHGEGEGGGEVTTTHEAVDLGLSVKWAATNLGADALERPGAYYAWGETSTKEYYTYDNHLPWGELDAERNLSPSHDAATANWGRAWRMPTVAEFQELIERCTWLWTSVDGMAGALVTGPSGNSIFLPAAGCFINYEMFEPGISGRYWSSTFNYDKYAYYLDISQRDFVVSFISTKNGCSIRPVHP